MRTKYFFYLLFTLYTLPNFAQTQIKGTVVEVSENKLVANAMISLYNDIDNKIQEYKLTDTNGTFLFSKLHSEGIYRLEISKIGYEKSIQKIVIGTNQNKTIDIETELFPKDQVLEELTINVENAIVVKQDTILYNIDRFRDKHDESLEEVLSKISGFKILPNGELEVNGKTIQKVLIDDKEVSDFGAAMITKSLTPEKVKSVEVRFDEKKTKLKESLLDDEKFVVLNIKLKSDVKKTFFGKQQLTTGYQDKLKVGGLTNLFSLNEKVNVQFFAENNNFGKNTINLTQIRNIGEEASARMFSLPADIDNIKQRNGYHDEIYGFDNFIANDNSIMGLSVNIPINEKTDLYLGSFNNYQFIKNHSERNLYYNETLLNNFSETNFFNEYNSKNKIQLKHTSKRFKISTDLNYVYFDQKLNNSILNNMDFNLFDKKHHTNNVYFNNKAEYVLAEKWVLVSNFSYTRENFFILTDLHTANAFMAGYLGLDEDFRQENNNKQSVLNNQLKLTYKSKRFGTHAIGHKFHSNMLQNEKISNVLDFNAQQQEYQSKSHSVIYNGFYLFDKLYIDLGIEYSFIKFPYEEKEKYTAKTKGYFQYKFSANYDFDMFTNIRFSSSNQVDVFPLHKATFGNVLIDFQTIFLTNQSISPYYNTNYSLTFSKVYSKNNELTIAYLRGISKNVNNQSFDENIVFLNSDQLSNSYHLFSTTYKNKISTIPLSLVFEPEFIINSSEYLIANEVENATVYRFLSGLKFNYALNEQINISYYPKYSHFIFKNSTSQSQERTFNFLTNTMGVNFYFLEQKLMTQINYKQVNFFQTTSHFNSFNLAVTYRNDRCRYFVQLNNLLNSKSFITEELDQNLLNVNNNQVFGRFINFGFEFKIN